jgi:hypothetical protein
MLKQKYTHLTTCEMPSAFVGASGKMKTQNIWVKIKIRVERKILIGHSPTSGTLLRLIMKEQLVDLDQK